MGRFSGGEEVDLEEKLDQLRLENQIEGEKGDMLEKRILQKQLRKKYGRNWKKMIGDIKDNETLRQFAEAGSGFDISRRRESPEPREQRMSIEPRRERRGDGGPHHGLPSPVDDNYALPNPGARFRLL